MTVKRSPYRVGQKLSVEQFKSQSPRFNHKAFPTGTGGFVVKEIHKTNHASGGYLFTAESVRNVGGERLKASWMVTFPSFGRATVKTAYYTSLRFWSGNGFTESQDEKPFNPSIEASISEQRKLVGSDERQHKMVLADFLEE